MNHTPVTDTMEFGVPGLPLEPGDHICALYVSQTERDQIMLPFLRAGLVENPYYLSPDQYLSSRC